MSTMHELPEHRTRSGIFRDRTDAGEHLAAMLSPVFAGDPEAIVLAIPSGGVPVGLALSRRLDLGFDLLLVRKMQIPWNTEAGFGALALGGEPMLNRQLVDSLGLSRQQIEEQTEATRKELEERNAAFREGAPPPELQGRTAILTDDGLASGYTMLAAIRAVREQGASQIILALPTAPRRSVEHVARFADAVYAVQIKDVLSFAVAEAYRSWHDLSRQEVVEMLRGASLFSAERDA